MRRLVPLFVLAVLAAPDAWADTRRFALVAGSNRGAGRAPLRYAVTDAERFAAIVTEMGGVKPADCIVLREPTRQAFLDALRAARASAGAARGAADRVELIV